MKILNLKMFIMLTLLFSTRLMAEGSRDKWMATPLNSNDKNNSESKIFKRYVTAGVHVYEVGSVTYFKTPVQDELPDNMVETIEKAYGGKDWRSYKTGNELVIEGIWEGANRFIRYQISQQDKILVVTMATLRIGYLDTINSEANYIQSTMIKWGHQGQVLKKKIKKVSAIDLLIMTIATAQAIDLSGLIGQSPGVGSNSGGLPTGLGGMDPGELSKFSNSMDQFSQSFDSLSVQVEAANANMATSNVNWGNTNEQLEGANKNWDGTNKQLEGANKNWGDSNKQAEGANKNWSDSNKQISDFNANVDKMNSTVDKNWNETNRQYARTNDLAEKMLDPKHMFTLAAATSAGAVFGATLANLVIDGVTAGAKFVWDLITDTSGKKDRWEKFTEARKKWDETLTNAQKLEKLLDQFLMNHELMKKVKDALTPEEKAALTRENLISHLSIRNRKLGKTKKQIEKLYEETEIPACETYYAKQLDKIESMSSFGTDLKGYLEKQTFNTYDDSMFCDQLSAIFNKLGEAEAAIQSYRLNILNSRAEWEDRNEENIEKTADTVNRLAKPGTHKDFMKKRIDNAKDFYEELEDAVKVKRKAWVDTCAKRNPKYETNHFHNDDNNYNWRNSKIEKECEKSYKENFDTSDKERLERAKASRDLKIEQAKRDFEISLSRPVEINPEAEDQRLVAYYKWFRDLEDQQYCYVNKDEKKCKDSATAKFMGPFYVKDRAKVKLKELCGQDPAEY